MSKFNRALKAENRGVVARGHDAVNRGGGLAYADGPQMALYRQVATSLWSGDGYYEKQAEWFARFQANVDAALAVDPTFPFKLAAYARDKRGLALRTSALALFVEAIANPRGKGHGDGRSYAGAVLKRADEPAEAIAYFKRHHKGVLPHSLMRGIQDVLPTFDAYQLAKYKGPADAAVTLRDVLRLARPKPATGSQAELWKQAVAGTLPVPETWEVEISAAKSDDEKRAAWNNLLAGGKLGTFALVRNLRNMLKVGADIETALEQLTPERVRGSGILPFQWYKAWKVMREHGGALAAPLQSALEASLTEVDKLPGVTVVASDNSGSMSSVEPTKGMNAEELANLMGAMAVHVSERAMAGTFGDHFDFADVNPHHGMIHNKAQIDRCGLRTGHSTNAWEIFRTLNQERIKADRVIIFSDMQCYDSAARQYAGRFESRSLASELDAYRQANPEVVVYSVNLASQDNTTQFAPDQPVVELAGFSESVFRFIAAMEAGDGIVTEINKKY
jgi:hypothetical protein